MASLAFGVTTPEAVFTSLTRPVNQEQDDDDDDDYNDEDDDDDYDDADAGRSHGVGRGGGGSVASVKFALLEDEIDDNSTGKKGKIYNKGNV